jgi:hypothetical protein
VIAFEFAYGPRMRALGLVIALLLVQACAPTLSADLPIARSTAPSAGEDTALGREFAPDVRSHPGESGFRLLDEGQDASRPALLWLTSRSGASTRSTFSGATMRSAW